VAVAEAEAEAELAGSGRSVGNSGPWGEWTAPETKSKPGRKWKCKASRQKDPTSQNRPDQTRPKPDQAGDGIGWMMRGEGVGAARFPGLA
jgi:hypothetical protein